jgi:hypothetical protein
MPHVDTVTPHADTKPHSDASTKHIDTPGLHTDTTTHSDIAKRHADTVIPPPPLHTDKVGPTGHTDILPR